MTDTPSYATPNMDQTSLSVDLGEYRSLCILAAEVVGGPSLDAALGVLEARHVVDRGMRRIDLAVEANKGTTLRREPMRVLASFERSDHAILAASEMLERTSNLPPLAGKRLSVRVGLHTATVFGDDPSEEDFEITLRLLRAAQGGEALATEPTLAPLPQAIHQLAKKDVPPREELSDLPWPTFHLSARKAETAAVVSLPPAQRLSQRLKVRHQQDVFFLDEQRPILLLGRELGNDIVIMDPRASRQHSRIERRREGFVLIDYSSNGCYIGDDNQGERRVRHGEVLLVGPGRIGCGFSTTDIDRDLVFFEVI